MLLRTLIPSLDKVTASGPQDLEIEALTADSREAGAGKLYAAIRGTSIDGHKFIADVIGKGVSAILAETAPPSDLPDSTAWLHVPDSRAALAALAVAFHGDPAADLRIAGITGTNGKTTTAFLVHHIMQAEWHRAGLLGTIFVDDGETRSPAKHTTPGSIELNSILATFRDNACRGAVMEVSSHGIHQKRIHRIAFDAAVFTNLTQDHLDYHGTMEKYMQAKASWFHDLAADPQGKKPTAVINTDDAHGKARIQDIDTTEIEKRMATGQVAVVAGFQGIGSDGRITTLGRGGSDTSAVALAAALHADRCDIFTDVEGVYTTDPRIVAKARKLDKITYEEMLEMASLGAKVLQTRSVELAMNHNVRLHVCSSFVDAPGTLVVEENEIVEKEVVSGIAYSKDEAKITLIRVADRPGVAAAIFGPLSDANVNVDMIVQNVAPGDEKTDVTFTVPRGDLERSVAVIESLKSALNYQSVATDANVVKVSVIGVGMRSHAGIAAKMFEALAEKGINIQVISTSEIKISVLIAAEYTELALRALHTAYELDDT